MTQGETAPDKPSEWPLSALAFMALAVGLQACLANLLNYHNYPVFRAEAGLVAAALLGIAALAAGLHRLAQPRLSFLLTGLFSAVLIDLGTDLHTAVFPVLTGVLAFAAWRFERVVLKLTGAAFASVLLFQGFDLVRTPDQPPAPRNEAKRLQDDASRNPTLRPIIHLMLDSYIGLDGMDAAGTNFGDLRQQQERFYLERGFQLYPGAYSRHAKTINSLPEMLSYGRAKPATGRRDLQSTVAEPLPYFLDLDSKGYRTSVAAPSFVDLCPLQPLSQCHNYNRSNLSSMADTALSAQDRALVIGATMLELSQFTHLLSGTIDLQIDTWHGSTKRHLYNRAKLYSLTGFDQIDAFTRDLATLKGGEARFAHLLLPHDPYLLDAACKLLPESEWGDEHGPLAFGPRDAAYARQARCVTEVQIAALLKALDATEAGRNAIVIIQGDHGSRTLDGEPSVMGGAPDPRTAAVAYSTFFAIRVPGEQAAMVNGMHALDALIGDFAASGFAKAPRPIRRPAEVHLMDAAWTPVKRVPLPPFVPKF
ncbi:MAG: hypothetical protein C0515_10700 [Novosphingobium sp.]|nr:hypothetical protein [Novosphingobium sp.]